MATLKSYPVPADFKAKSLLNETQYKEMYQHSIDDPEGFWSEQANALLSWYKPWDTTLDWSYAKEDLHINWFKGGKLNVSYNCIDRHLEERSEQVAIIWEGDDPAVDKKITYRELHTEVSKLANVLKQRGVKKGDRVLFSSYAGDEFKLDGDELVLMREDDILAILED